MASASATRVAFVSNSARGECSGRLKWIPQLRARGFDVTFVLPRGENEYVQRIARAGVPVLEYGLNRRSFSPTNDVQTVVELARLFRQQRFTVVHTFGHKANIFGSPAAAAARAPVILNHLIGLGEAFTPGGGARRAAVRVALRGMYRAVSGLVTRFLFQNQDDSRQFAFLPSAKRLFVGGTGVDTREFSSGAVAPDTLLALRRELGLGADSVVVTYVGRLLVEKGIPEILAAARSLTARDTRLVFLIVGSLDPGSARSLREADLRPYATGPIRFLGRRDDVRDILAATDVFVNPSYYGEGVPRTNLEALAMARPVVTADAPGCRDTVEHGETGFLIPPREAQALERALEQLIGSPDLRARMGAAARRQAETRFSVEESVRRVVEVYRSLPELTDRPPAIVS